MPILNMVGGGGGGVKIPLDAISDLAAVKGNAKATITWTDPDNKTYDGISLVAWTSTILVRKVGSAPTSSSDGTVVVTSTTKNQYSSTGYEDTGLTNGTTYYYAAFAVGDNGTKVISNTTSVTPYAPKTFTVSWTEKSAPTQWTNTYSDDARGKSAGSTAFDEFFGYSLVLLDDSGNEVAEVTQAESGGNGNLKISLLEAKGIIDGSSSSTNNVMIKFPRRGIKMTKSGTTVTLSITEEPNKAGYQYYAFNDNGVTKDYMYLGVYKGARVSNKLRSISGNSSIGNFSLPAVTQWAQSTGTGYHVETLYARQLINAYYKMKYANPNSQSVIGMGYVNGSAAQSTGATNSIDTATGATNTSNTGRIKLFGLEDWWGNVSERLDGARISTSSSKIETSTTQAFPTSGNTRITTFDKSITVSQVSRGCLASIVGTNDGLFLANTTSGTNSTYYCDEAGINNGDEKYFMGGLDFSSGANAGVFALTAYWAGSSLYFASFGARLMYL